MSTSGVPQTGESGMKIGSIQVTPPSLERLDYQPPYWLLAVTPNLVLESVASAVGVIYRKPLFVASRGGSKTRKRLPAVDRAPHVVKKSFQKAEIEKLTGVIAGQNRVAPENVVLENAGECPGRAAVAGVSPTGLPEIGSNAVELPPTYDHPVAVGWIDADRRLVRGVARDIHAVKSMLT